MCDGSAPARVSPGPREMLRGAPPRQHGVIVEKPNGNVQSLEPTRERYHPAIFHGGRSNGAEHIGDTVTPSLPHAESEPGHPGRRPHGPTLAKEPRYHF